MSASTIRIEIDRNFKNFLIRELNVNTARYTAVTRRFIRSSRMSKYFRHNANEGLVNLTQLELKFVPERIVSIRKRINNQIIYIFKYKNVQNYHSKYE